MMAVPILEAPIQRWRCPNCGATDMTREFRPHSQMHTCPAMGFLSAPMLPEGTRAKVYAVDRGDYEGKDLAQRDADGRVVMAIVTERDEGQDVIALAPLIRTSARS